MDDQSGGTAGGEGIPGDSAPACGHWDQSKAGVKESSQTGGISREGCYTEPNVSIMIF